MLIPRQFVYNYNWASVVTFNCFRSYC